MNETEAIKKGFNAGYQLEKSNPELARQLRDGFTDKEHPYAQGFIAGIKEYALEKARSAFKSRLQDQSKEKQKEKGRDLDR